MKSNKQRAEIIMDRYNNNNQPTNEHKTKKVAWWKIVTAVCCSVVLIFTASFGAYMLWGRKDKLFDIDNMYIANFSGYNAIGVGYIKGTSGTTNGKSKSGMQVLNAASSTSESNQRYLIGKKLDGSVEKIAFSKQQNGKANKSQNKGVFEYMRAFTRFTFVQWSGSSTYNPSIANNSSFSNNTTNSFNYSHRTIVIDNKTGKIFDLSENSSINTIDFNNRLPQYAYEAENYLYFISGLYRTDKQTILYRMSIENDKLKIEEIYSKSELNYDLKFVDKYGNVYLMNDIFSSSSKEIQYMITADKNDPNRLRPINVELFRSTNGIVYTKDKTKRIDANGDFVENSFIGCDKIVYKENLIKTIDNTEYYFGRPSMSGDNKIYPTKSITKITWIDDEVYECEEIPVEEYSENFVSTDDYIFFYKDEKVFSVDILTGAKHDLVSNYVFTGISADHLGNVMFTGLSSSLNNVTGIIYNDGTIDISEDARRYKVYYIKPLN